MPPWPPLIKISLLRVGLVWFGGYGWVWGSYSGGGEVDLKPKGGGGAHLGKMWTFAGP